MIDLLTPPTHQRVVLTKSELLAQAEKAAGSRANLARVLGIAPARITEMFKGGRDLSFDEARTLITRFRLDPDSGETTAALSLEDVAAEHDIALIEEVDLALGMGGGAFADLAESKGLVPFKSEWLRGLYSGPLSALRVVRGRGDSMQPTILDGDLVVVDTSQNNVLDQDRLWAVFWGDLGMIKRVRRAPGGKFLLMSDNAAVPPIEAVDEELHVTGRVIWIGRRM